jgi:hypothetical protein
MLSLLKNGLAGSAQRKLVLNDPTLLVLSTVHDARAQLPGHDEDDILALIEEGQIPWAWNIALKSQNAAREIRIWPDCIAHYRNTGGQRPYRSAEPELNRILLDGKPFVNGSRLKLIFNCGATHIINLVDSKQLRVMPGTKYHRGPNGSPAIEAQSLLNFLNSRLLI